MSLYTDLVSEGIPVSNWQSDLYCLANEQSRSLVEKYGLKYGVFTSNIDGKLWLSIPFQFDPFWQGKNK